MKPSYDTTQIINLCMMMVAVVCNSPLVVAFIGMIYIGNILEEIVKKLDK
jgi:hypothetical protein